MAIVVGLLLIATLFSTMSRYVITMAAGHDVSFPSKIVLRSQEDRGRAWQHGRSSRPGHPKSRGHRRIQASWRGSGWQRRADPPESEWSSNELTQT